MQDANEQISERRPPIRGNSACVGKTKPANTPSNLWVDQAVVGLGEAEL